MVDLTLYENGRTYAIYQGVSSEIAHDFGDFCYSSKVEEPSMYWMEWVKTMLEGEDAY